MSMFRIRQQLPLVLCVMRHYEDGKLKTKHVREILCAIENFHFVFTAVTSQRSSGGISFMYASAARDLYAAATAQAKLKVLQQFKKKLELKKPQYIEFEPAFLDLKYSSKFTKQKNLVRYILARIYQQNSTGLAIDFDQMTIEHISPEKPPNNAGVSEEEVALIGNLILVDQTLNNKLANKNFAEKIAILKKANVWIDKIVLNSAAWGAKEIQERGKLLSHEGYNKVWPL